MSAAAARTEPVRLEADVLVIGSGAAGMYASVEAARAGAPDHWSHHYQAPLTPARGLCNEPLSRLLCEEGPSCIEEMDAWGVGWARKNGKITSAFAPGHDRPRGVYVDFLNTGPAVSKTLRTVVRKTPGISR